MVGNAGHHDRERVEDLGDPLFSATRTRRSEAKRTAVGCLRPCNTTDSSTDSSKPADTVPAAASLLWVPNHTSTTARGSAIRSGAVSGRGGRITTLWRALGKELSGPLESGCPRSA
jgi:hypothetical protein